MMSKKAAILTKDAVTQGIQAIDTMDLPSVTTDILLNRDDLIMVVQNDTLSSQENFVVPSEFTNNGRSSKAFKGYQAVKKAVYPAEKYHMPMNIFINHSPVDSGKKKNGKYTFEQAHGNRLDNDTKMSQGQFHY